MIRSSYWRGWPSILLVGILLMLASASLAVPTKICFEAEAGKLSKPFQLVTAKQAGGRDQKRAAQSASGGAFLEILEGVNPKDKSKIVGEVTYHINLPASGQYQLWAYTDWLNSCSNSFEVIIYPGSSLTLPKNASERKQFVLGEDSIYRRWHWVDYKQPLSLKQGIVTLRLRNREDGVRVDRIFLCQDPAYVPGERERNSKGALATVKSNKGK